MELFKMFRRKVFLYAILFFNLRLNEFELTLFPSVKIHFDKKVFYAIEISFLFFEINLIKYFDKRKYFIEFYIYYPFKKIPSIPKNKSKV